jgi:hypothetical protein
MKVLIETTLDGYRDGNRGELWRTLANVTGRTAIVALPEKRAPINIPPEFKAGAAGIGEMAGWTRKRRDDGLETLRENYENRPRPVTLGSVNALTPYLNWCCDAKQFSQD